jgi:hypothetical protein
MTSQGNYELSGLPPKDPLEAWLNLSVRRGKFFSEGCSCRSGAGPRVVSGCLKGRGRSISRALNAKTD